DDERRDLDAHRRIDLVLDLLHRGLEEDLQLAGIASVEAAAQEHTEQQKDAAGNERGRDGVAVQRHPEDVPDVVLTDLDGDCDVAPAHFVTPNLTWPNLMSS